MLPIRRRTTLLVILATALTAALIVTLLAAQHGTAPRATRSGSAPSAASTSATPTATALPTHMPPSPVPSGGTTSADVYASQLARALWSVDYAHDSRAQAERYWRGQLADVLPAGTPAGTTVAQAQQAALDALDTRLPSDGMWATLAASRTRSAFTVTSVSEPASWISAIASGQITDPGLTARTVLGVQTLTYGTPEQTARQTQQLTLVMLCPPTTAVCRLEIIPPDSNTGS